MVWLSEPAFQWHNTLFGSCKCNDKGCSLLVAARSGERLCVCVTIDWGCLPSQVSHNGVRGRQNDKGIWWGEQWDGPKKWMDPRPGLPTGVNMDLHQQCCWHRTELTHWLAGAYLGEGNKCSLTLRRPCQPAIRSALTWK